MIKEETLTETKVRKTIICDFCGEPSPYIYSSVKPCRICEKDICYDCAIKIDFWDSDLTDPYEGDHPDYICKPCWEGGKAIREEIMQVRNKATNEEQELIKRWEAMCATLSIPAHKQR